MEYFGGPILKNALLEFYFRRINKIDQIEEDTELKPLPKIVITKYFP